MRSVLVFMLLFLLIHLGCSRIRGTYFREDHGVCGPTYSMKFVRGDSVLVTRHGWWDSVYVHDYRLMEDTISITARDDPPDELKFLMKKRGTIEPVVIDKDFIPMGFWGLSQPFWKRKRAP